MRHYYRFMELEPVMEQEEDSVGEGSPTSSMGSPSFSPPPDAWAQISSKEYHDTLSNHMLQEHMDLQRAYRLLEVQLRNCDTRASRDLQRLKEALPNQDRLREELQRAKERETLLRGEIYDLQEQNELLEFRILELEECHENASVRSGNPTSRDVATETDTGDITDVGHTSHPIDAQIIGETQRVQARLVDDAPPVSPLPSTSTTCDRDQRQTRADVGDITEQIHTLAPQSDNQSTPPEQLQTTQRTDTQEDQPSHSSDSECNQFSTHILTSLSEGISCTLCRRLPRRRSYHGSSQFTLVDVGDKDEETQRDCLRKSKSDGEIKARHDSRTTCASSDIDQHHSPVRKREDDLDGGSKGDVEEPAKRVEVTVKDEGVQVDVVEERRNRFSGTRVEEQVKTMRTMLNAIYDVLRETRVEVECTNSELREEVETLETTVQRLTQEVERRGEGGGGEEAATLPRTKGPPLVRRSRSLSFSKECYCCSQELRPTLEQVISKLQQLMDLVVDAAANPANEPNKTEVTTLEEIVNSEEKSDEQPSEVMDSGVSVSALKDAHTLPELNECIPKENKPVIAQKPRRVEDSCVLEGFEIQQGGSQLEGQTKEALKQPLLEQTVPVVKVLPTNQTFNDHVRPKLQQDDWKMEPRIEEQIFASKGYESQAMPNVAESQILAKKEEPVMNNDFLIPPFKDVVGISYPDPRQRFSQLDGNTAPGAEEATNQIEIDPLPEEKTKPVLRRWREQLLVRRDRVQPWRIEMLDFPKRLPSVV